MVTRDRNGGLIEIDDLKRALEITRGSAARPISVDDIERSIRKLKVLGSGYNVISLGSLLPLRSLILKLSDSLSSRFTQDDSIRSL
jgi:ESCRT-II complex subunit VPS22